MAASGGRAELRAELVRPIAPTHSTRIVFDLSFCAAPKDADRTYVKRDPIIIWQSVVAFAPRESEGAERWQYSLAIRFERAVHTEKGGVKQPNLAVLTGTAPALSVAG